MASAEEKKADVVADAKVEEGAHGDNPEIATAAAAEKKVIEIPAELSQRHPLQSPWALWYLKGDRSKAWEDCLKRVSVFDTVEDFWALYNHIQPASGLTWGSDYYLFKDGIKPMWEDPNNIRGGRWIVGVEKHKRATKLDQYWLELMMAIIGEQFEELGEHICGAVVNVRQKGDKVVLWTRDAEQDDVNRRIGEILKKKLDIPDTESIRYELHKDASTRVGSSVKPKITIPAKDQPTTSDGGAATAVDSTTATTTSNAPPAAKPATSTDNIKSSEVKKAETDDATGSTAKKVESDIHIEKSAESATETKAKSDVDPKKKKADTDADSKAKSDADPKTKAEGDDATGSSAAKKVDVDTKKKAESVTTAKDKSDVDQKKKAESGAPAKDKSDVDPKKKAESVTTTKSEVDHKKKADIDADSKAKSDADHKPKAESSSADAKTKSHSDSKKKAKSGAKNKKSNE